MDAMLQEPLSKRPKIQSEPPVDSAGDLRAGRKKPPWTPTEQAVVAIKHCELGNRWTQIAAYLPLRSENDVKNIWHSTLRCKDTQKRSFLRTYALAVHDHAYDYAARKAMFDIAVRQCGPPPPQAAEMIARVQLMMDNPDLQAQMQQQMQQQEQQMLQQDQLAQLTQLLQKRDDLQSHPHLAHIAQLQQLQQQHPHLMLLQQQSPHDADGQQDGGDMELGDTATHQRANAASKLASAKSIDKNMLDVRRLLQAREKYGGGKYEEAFEDSYAAAEDALASELEQQQQRKHATHLQGQGQGSGANGLRNQGSEPLEAALRNNPDLSMSALRRYNAAMQGQGSSGGGAAPAGGSGGYSAPPPGADPLPSALANMAAVAAAAAAAEQQQQPGGGGAAATGGEAQRPLPGLGNLLALLYKFNTEQGAPMPLPTAGWSPGRGEGGEEGNGGAEAPGSAVGNGGAAGAAAGTAATTAAAPAGEEDERSGTMAATGATTSSQGPQSLALRSLALRPLGKRERESDVKDDEDAAADGAPGSGDRSVEGSPKRPASVRVAARRAQQAATAAAAAAPMQPSQPGGLRPRNSLPYTLEDADADELGAVEALALAARLNTGGGRTPGGGPNASGRSSAGNLAAAAGNGGGEAAGRISGSSNASAPGGGLRNGAAGATAAPGARPGANAAGGGGGAVLDLHARQTPAAAAALPLPPPPAPPPPPPRSLMRPHSSDLHSSTLQQRQQQQRSSSQTLDVISVLNMPGLRRQVLSLPSQTLVALLSSPVFGSDAEASVLLLVALWLQFNNNKVTAEQARAVCGAVRLAALGGFYLSAVLPQLLTEPRVGASAAGKGSAGTVAANARPGGRWFELRNEELAFLTRYVHAGAAERALLVDVARGMYDCGSPWYDMTPRYLGSPAEGFCFEWHIPENGLREALSNGTQPHASFTVNDDISDGDGGGSDGSVAVVQYILCRGLEWHVFVDCQQQRRGGGGTGPGGAGGGSSSVAGVFVYCRVPAALRAPGAAAGGFVGVVPGAGIRLGVHGWRCGRLEEVFVWTFGDETYFVPDAGMGCPSALPLRNRPSSPAGGVGASGAGRGGAGPGPGAAAAADPATTAWADYLHEGGLRGTLTFLPH
ncbi:hypothetical protein PLESTB_001054200 [Pleodorina starrii]|uniref:Uncharacterized protein n=1 Tax=Pleodorina starrii TaxID=330485 RepID=A0A9W6BQ99_9CHLO|nr:hypothetical protein PLESTB_001054200 [Pleodorina starrii]